MTLTDFRGHPLSICVVGLQFVQQLKQDFDWQRVVQFFFTTTEEVTVSAPQQDPLLTVSQLDSLMAVPGLGGVTVMRLNLFLEHCVL